LPHQATLLPIGDPFIELSTVDSTNNYAMAQVRTGRAKHGTAFFAHNQTAGKGQRGKSWTTENDSNIILSVVFEHINLKPRDSFYFSASVALACYDFFKTYAGSETTIKWPNDVYWRDRKAGGILIENILKNDSWISVAGIGININQTAFDAELANPVSLKMITGQSYNPVSLGRELCLCLQKFYEQLYQDREWIIVQYNSSLYKLNQVARLKQENRVFETMIKGVTSSGKLMTIDDLEQQFNSGEVEWVL
jgi:BirA family biotin operon repressor/biotin-[acetyl-CoA-carboxylase] ligase